MSKITVEMEDTLQECVDGAIEQVEEQLREYLEENKPDKVPELNDMDYSGGIHEIVDGAVPIYTKEIGDLWYLHAYDLEEAYDTEGIGDNPRENNGMVAIYCYISQGVNKWYQENSKDIFDEWVEAKDKAFTEALTKFVRESYPNATDNQIESLTRSPYYWCEEDHLDLVELRQCMEELDEG